MHIQAPIQQWDGVFCENNQWLVAVSYFHGKASL